MSRASIFDRIWWRSEKHEIFLLSDLAYAEVYFDDDKSAAFSAAVPGAIRCHRESPRFEDVRWTAGEWDLRRKRTVHSRIGAG